MPLKKCVIYQNRIRIRISQKSLIQIRKKRIRIRNTEDDMKQKLASMPGIQMSAMGSVNQVAPTGKISPTVTKMTGLYLFDRWRLIEKLLRR